MIIRNLKLDSIGVNPKPGMEVQTVTLNFDHWAGKRVTVEADMSGEETVQLNELFRTLQGNGQMFQLRLEKAIE